MKENRFEAERQPVKCDGALLLGFDHIAVYQNRIDTCAEDARVLSCPDVLTQSVHDALDLHSLFTRPAAHLSPPPLSKSPPSFVPSSVSNGSIHLPHRRRQAN